jgi:HAE1 family hydrophobic/amphiphilic exporter-1
VLVRSVDTRAASIEEVRNLVVNPGGAHPVTLSAVADVRLATGPAEIRRANQERVAVISAAPADGDLGAATIQAREILSQTTLPVGILGSVSGQSEEMTESFRSLGLAFALAVFLVYLVMASQFESLLHPFVILFTIPLALVGAVLALLITNSAISVVVFIGLILLVGLVVKNAIILIDKVNQLREDGVAKHDALVQGAASRLRPIIMTTLCTLFGFLPLAAAPLFGSPGAEVRSPMALTVIGGLLVSTLLTLVVIPVVYDLMDRRGDEYYRERGRRHRGELDHEGETGEGGAIPEGAA